MEKEVIFHPHALERMVQRGATEEEIYNTIRSGEQFPAKHGRIGFRRNFIYNDQWEWKIL